MVGRDIGGYRIERFIARGGMGAVYVARQLRLDRLVALKVIAPELAEDPGFRERFERESRIAASIDHPNVVPIYEAGEHDGLLYIAMRFVDGHDLKAVIAEHGPLPPQYAVDIVRQVGAALDAAHAKGLVHRDVKPANVMLERHADGDRAYLSDFGLTKRVASGSALTKTGVVVGTLDYIAPEQLHGGPVDARTDVYALACVLFHALTGRVPYPREDDMAKMYAHAQLPPPSVLEAVPGLPPRLADVIARGMAKDPADRFVSAGDLGRAAAAACAGHAPPAAERSVATGAAAPPTQVGATVAAPYEAATNVLPASTPPPSAPPSAPPAAPPPAPPAPQWSPPQRPNRWPLFAGIAVALAALGVAAALLLTAGDDEGEDPTTSQASTVTTTTTGPTTTTTEPPTLPQSTQFATYTSADSSFRADLPTGDEWSEPEESSPNDQLFAVTQEGPDGLELLVNFTPGEAARVTPADSCDPVDHPQFSEAQKCVFKGGGIEACNRTQCVDYLLNDSDAGPGWAVLVGGGPPSQSEAIARRVAESLVPLGVGG